MRTIDTLIGRLRAEFMEMPGLRLTSEQAQRLRGVERIVCQLVLEALVDAKFLSRKPDGTYGRVTDGPGPDMWRPQPAKADLGVEKRLVKVS